MDPNGNLFLRVQQKIKEGKKGEDYDGTHRFTPSGVNQQSRNEPHTSKPADEIQGTSSGNNSVIIIPDTPSPVFSRFVGKRGKQVGGKLLNHTSDGYDGTGDGNRGPTNSKTKLSAKSQGSEGTSYKRSRPPREPMLTPEKHSLPWKQNISEGKHNNESVPSSKGVSSFHSKFLDAKSKIALSPGKVKISPYVPSHGIHFKTAFQEMMERNQERSRNESNHAVHNQEQGATKLSHSSSGHSRKQHDPSGLTEPCNHVNKRSAKLSHRNSDKPSHKLTIEQSKGQDSERQHHRKTACNVGQRKSEASSSPKIKRARLDGGFHNKEFYNAYTWPSESSDSDDSEFDSVGSQTLQAMLDHSCNPQTNSPISAAPALNVTPPKVDWPTRVHRVKDGAKECVNHAIAKHVRPKSPVSSLHDITSSRSSNHNPQGPQVDNESSGAHRQEEKLDGNKTKNVHTKVMKSDQREQMSGWFDDGFSRMAESDWSPSVSEESRSHSRKMASERSRSIQLAALESRSNKSKNTYQCPGTDQGYTPAIQNPDLHGSPNQPIICENVKESKAPQNQIEQVEGDEELAKKLQEQMDMEFAMSLQNLENQPPVFGAGVFPHHDMSLPSPVVAYNRGPVAVGQGRWATAQRGRTTSRYPDLDEVEALLRDLDEPEERLLQNYPQSRAITRNAVRPQSARINNSLLSMLEGGSPPLARQPRSRRRGQRRIAAPRGFDVGSPAEGNDYEDLLSLAEMLGDVKTKGLTEAQSSRLPVRLYQANSEKQESEDCLICMCEYDQDDRLKMLPCFHEFHEQCIDKWIKGNASCPVCRVEVKLT
ncbi:uncharacterized protein LOC110460444 isoform X2 [Mizuhopecten yessoensis]|uniref:uncharacterized protein LOC110460444 isoform X2 n=1 Tax=Mizuhopecten yessoensis TaxID=6573 RepID=UPI000B45F8D5|nr:uncharacterized protein LOC110460444 isoform X2 [Mizuhopecten yessoensis]